MSFGLIGLFRKLFSAKRRGVRYLSDASYWMYIIHLPLVMAAQWLVRDWDFPAIVKFVLICAAVSALLLATYRAFVRYTPIGMMLNGRRARPQSIKSPAT
jgi:peptidoglycan/LPS O-acetylase OafA/YrhL